MLERQHAEAVSGMGLYETPHDPHTMNVIRKIGHATRSTGPQGHVAVAATGVDRTGLTTAPRKWLPPRLFLGAGKNEKIETWPGTRSVRLQ
jgi:hypothetical protein